MTVETFPTNPLGLQGTPLQIEAFFAGLVERWRDILGPFREVRIGRLGAVSRGHKGAIRSLEPQMADVDRVFEELADRAGAEIDVGALARGCRDASPLIPEVLEMAAGVGRFLLKAVLEGLEADYDGDPFGVFFGSPAEARAWRALMDHSDAGHFLRVFGAAGGEDALSERVAGLELPVEAFAQRAAQKDWDQFTVPELREWRDVWVEAAYLVAEAMATRRTPSPESMACREDPGDEAEILAALDASEMLVAAASAVRPRGYADHDEGAARELENLRRRTERRLDAARAR